MFKIVWIQIIPDFYNFSKSVVKTIICTSYFFFIKPSLSTVKQSLCHLWIWRAVRCPFLFSICVSRAANKKTIILKIKKSQWTMKLQKYVKVSVVILLFNFLIWYYFPINISSGFFLFDNSNVLFTKYMYLR